MENGFYFYKRQLDKADNYNEELIRIVKEIDKKLRKTQNVCCDIIEDKKRFLFFMDDCLMDLVMTEVAGCALMEVNIPKTFVWGEGSDFKSISDVYENCTKSDVTRDKRNIRILFNGIIGQREILLRNGIKSSQFK